LKIADGEVNRILDLFFPPFAPNRSVPSAYPDVTHMHYDGKQKTKP